MRYGLKDMSAIFQPKISRPFVEDGKKPSLKGRFFLRQTIFQSQASDFSFCAK